MRDNNNSTSTESIQEDTSMDRMKLRKQRHKKLGNGKGKKVGFFESIGLKITGGRDGSKGVPRLTDDNAWYSTFMNREVNSYEEFCSHIWGSLQIENEDKFAKLEELMDGIRHKKERLEDARYNLEVAYRRENDSETIKKKGEDKLTDAQVGRRRRAEKENRLTPLKNKVAGLELELKEAEEAFANLHSRLVEDDNTTRLICHRVKDHTLMRIDVYWNSALMHHPEGASMPVIPTLELRNDSEVAYLHPHKELMKRAASIHEAIQDENNEREVA